MRVLEALLGLNALWQVEALIAAFTRITLLLGLAHVAVMLVPVRAPRTRERLLFMAITLLLIVPLVSPFMPRISLPVPVPAALNRIDNPVALGEAREAVARAVLGEERLGLVTARDRDARGPGAYAWLFWAWAGVASLLIVRRCVALQRLRAVIACARPATPRMTACLTRACARRAVERAPALLLCERFGTPAVTGIRQPIILLPPDCENWTNEQLELALAHELVHIERRDCLRETIASLTSALLWFHPLIWWSALQRRRLAELDCDHRVLATGARPAAYANLLLLATELPGPQPHGALLFATGDDLERRIRFLMRTPPAVAHHRVRAAAFTTLLVLGALTVAGLSARTVPCGPTAPKTAVVAPPVFFCPQLLMDSHFKGDHA